MASKNTNNIDTLQDVKDTLRMTNPVRPRLLTLKQAAKYLGRGVDSMRQLIYQRAFPVVQLGERSKLWLDIHDLDRWIDSHKGFIGES